LDEVFRTWDYWRNLWLRRYEVGGRGMDDENDGFFLPYPLWILFNMIWLWAEYRCALHCFVD
jgi:hypothetical protein